MSFESQMEENHHKLDNFHHSGGALLSQITYVIQVLESLYELVIPCAQSAVSVFRWNDWEEYVRSPVTTSVKGNLAAEDF